MYCGHDNANMNIYTEFNSVGCTFLHHRILIIQTKKEVKNPLTRRVNNNKIVKNNTTSVPLILLYFYSGATE